MDPAARTHGAVADPGAPSRRAPEARSAWRAVAVPTEHGGWGLTLEPVLLGLLVVPSWAGAALGLAAFAAFVARTPLKVVLVDRRRHRRLPRTVLAARIVVVEALVLAMAGAAAVIAGDARWLVPVGAAVPLVVVELWFDVRSRSRRLVPELAGALGIAAVAPAIVLAGGGPASTALAVWSVLASRALSSIPFVRVQVSRLHGAASVAGSDAAQAVGCAVACSAVVVDPAVVLGVVAVMLVAVAQAVGVRRPPVAAKVLGVRQMVAGILIVVLTALGTWWW